MNCPECGTPMFAIAIPDGVKYVCSNCGYETVVYIGENDDYDED